MAGSTKPQLSDKNSRRLPLTLKGVVQGSADPCVAGESTQMDPAEVSLEQQVSNRSICGSDAGTSNRSSNGKPRVAKVSWRTFQQEYIKDPKKRLAAMGMDAFLKPI